MAIEKSRNPEQFSRTVRARALLGAQSEHALAKIQQFLNDALSGMKGAGGGFDVPLPELGGSGTK
jgi:hypothetical protein